MVSIYEVKTIGFLMGFQWVFDDEKWLKMVEMAIRLYSTY